jgi:ribosomal protein S18 acetylase RimI-like enzyme
MNSRVLHLKHGPDMLVRPLKDGDIDTVLALFHRLEDSARHRRVNGAKARLSEDEVWQLSRADENHHALVAYVEGDPMPVALARLVRDGQRAEVAFEVAEGHQGRGIGSGLTRELLADARAAGITEVTALVRSDNPAAVALLRRVLGMFEISFNGRDLQISARLPAQLAHRTS